MHGQRNRLLAIQVLNRFSRGYTMTAEEWVDTMLNTQVLFPPGVTTVTKDSLDRTDLIAWVKRIQANTANTFAPMPGTDLTMEEIGKLSELVETVDTKFKNRTRIDLTEWEQLPRAFRKIRDYAMFLQGPLSDAVNDNTAHYDNWARIRRECYNQAITDAARFVMERAEKLKESTPTYVADTICGIAESFVQHLTNTQDDATTETRIRSFNEGVSAAVKLLQDEAEYWERHRHLTNSRMVKALADKIESLLKVQESSDE